MYPVIMHMFITTTKMSGVPPRFWPVVDNSLRAAAMERGVQVRLLGSHWNHTRADMKYYLKSLQDLNSTSTGMHIETVSCVTCMVSSEQDWDDKVLFMICIVT